jgi:hypothetical protein
MLTFSNPLSCLTGDPGAVEGSPIYTCATSAPATDPEFVIVAATVAAVSKREEEPPGTMVPDAAPEVGDPVMDILV